MVPHLTATGCHLSHSVTCHPTQVNTPRLNTSQTAWYSIYLPLRDGRLSWPSWLVTYRDGLPAHRRSPIQVLTQQWTRNLLITSLVSNLNTLKLGRIVLHSFSTAAMMSFYAEKCCQLMSAHVASASPPSTCDVIGSLYMLQFLIRHTFALVVLNYWSC